MDDSSDSKYQTRIDLFAAKYSDRVKVVRRPDRRGFKAGNLNNVLANVATQEPFFAIADADEILPPDFLTGLVPILMADPQCGFVQANHRCNPKATSPLAKALGIGIDIHWRWYQPLRNKFGFVMFLKIKNQEEYAMYVIMGATGNIGSKLANILLDKGEKVKVVGRSAERLKPFVDHGAKAAVGETQG